MNTNAVAKLLGVSPSTIQRWVKHANLTMNRNELGHYVFNEDDIEVMKKIQEQINNGVLLQDIAAAAKKTRQATIKKETRQPDYGSLVTKIKELEMKLDRKADEHVSYQLLQHRREIEELHNKIEVLTEKIELLEGKTAKEEHNPEEMVAATAEENKIFKRLKKKNFISSLFGF
ncbi:chromosome-anchoring protein RacA [Mesobacillus persicus]|uniref:Chromosome-anchoring protein RacA n=1 Tax=Mesobacillus persicus TaxID=930146 RepID=A0A1H8ETY6_9BACI|nr:MerR family transcriptional regulator [Mesobacillus persicus]SEN22935.1 chromosome-anchoring protein RacA [Mesobacillus persicus]